MAEATERNRDEDEDEGILPSWLFDLDGPFASFMRASNPMALFQQNMEFTQKMFDIALGSSKIAPDPVGQPIASKSPPA